MFSTRFPVPRSLDPVTTYDPTSEVSPRDVGLDAEGIAVLWGRVQDIYRSGIHPAVSVCIRHRGQVVMDRALGHAHGNGPGEEGVEKVLATPQTPFCIFSASKAITAMVIHLLDDRGVLHVDDPVAEYIPEFGSNGKKWVTIRHVLTHRAGIPSLGNRANEDLTRLFDWDSIVTELCEARPTSPPGRRLAYHAITGGFVLGEIVRRVTGRPIRRVLQDEVLDPLGFDLMNYGIARERLDEVASSYFTGVPVTFPVSRVVRRALGVSIARAVEVSNTPEWLTSVVPSGNIVSTANELCRFFELLRCEGELDGVRVMDRRTIHRACAETSYLEMDFTLVMPVRYGVGLMLGSRWLSPYGPHTPRAFGHIGLTNVFGWADPQRDLSVALCTSGKPLLGRHFGPLFQWLRAVSDTFPRTR